MSRTRPADFFQLSVTAETGRIYVPFLRQQIKLARIQAQRRKPSAVLRELSLVLVGDKQMSDLHQEFLSIAGPTDVLTFPMDTNHAGKVISGEIVVCVPEAKRQAAIRKLPIKQELLLYAIHGMLHLLGYDDRTKRAFRVMHSLEDTILTELGLGRVFAGRIAESVSRQERHR